MRSLGVTRSFNSCQLFEFAPTGGGSEVMARALSVPDLNQAQAQTLPAGLETEERSTMEREISQIDRMIEDMETKVNVLRWMVEPRGPQYTDPVSSTDSASLALVSIEEDRPGSRSQPRSQRSHIFVLVLLFAVILVAAILSVCVFLFS